METRVAHQTPAGPRRRTSPPSWRRLGLALPGTLIQRRVRCGWASCRCHADPPVLHGPYWQWTRKIDGKTVTRLVPDDQLADYRQWLDNHRRLRALVAELEDLTLAIADAEPRASAAAASASRHQANHRIKLWMRPA